MSIIFQCKKYEDINSSEDENKNISIRNTPMRIATNYGIAVYMLFTLGLQDRLIAVDKASLKNKLFNAIYPSFNKLKSTGLPSDFNIEQGIALKPDLLLVPGKNKELIYRLKDVDLPVFGVIAEDIQQIQDTIKILGKITGKEQKAEEFINFYKETLAYICKRIEAIHNKSGPLIYLSGPMGFLSTCSSDMYQSKVIKACGAINAGSSMSGEASNHGWIKISAEQLIKQDPDIILITRYSRLTPCEVLNDERFQQIKAIRNKRIYLFPSELTPWDFPSPESILGIIWLAKTIYPNKFYDIDLIAEANKFYNKFYNKSFIQLGGKL